jgi:hypothetical protein
MQGLQGLYMVDGFVRVNFFLKLLKVYGKHFDLTVG